MDLFEGMDQKATSVRQEDITGDQHTFHSLPKEFQAWHNTQYMLEKKVDIDESTVPEALLNAYMWKTVYDASKFAIPTVIGIIFSVIKLKLSPNIWGLIVSLSIYIPWLLYLAYHFIFYAKIKAQVVGPVTKKCAKFTADMFYTTFFAILSSLIVAFVFTMSILEDLALLLHNLIMSIDSSGSSDLVMSKLKHYMIVVYNGMIDLLSPPDTLFAKILANTYFSTALFFIMTLATVFLFERQVYNERKRQVEEEIEKEELSKGYPIDTALIQIHKWREEHGV